MGLQPQQKDWEHPVFWKNLVAGIFFDTGGQIMDRGHFSKKKQERLEIYHRRKVYQ